MVDYGFQEQLIDDSFNTLMTHESGGVVLAATPGAGKTEMSIEIIDRWLSMHKGSKVLVLTHGQTVLRNQYTARLSKQSRSFSHSVLDADDISTFDADVHIALPHFFKSRGVETKYDLIVVDEAHHFFFAPMIERIVQANSGAKLLLLTGSPSPFIKDGRYPLIYMTASQLLSSGVIADPVIELVSTEMSIGLDDYAEDRELYRHVNISSKQTRAAVSSALNALLNKLVVDRLTKAKDSAQYVKGKKLGLALNRAELGKTVIVARNQTQATAINAQLKSIGVSSAISTSDTDVDSAAVDTFRHSDTIKVLVVVNRATLGFDMPELENVIDMSMSHTPDRIFQALCRVVRKSADNKRKIFIKVTSKELAPVTYAVMCFTVALSTPEVYTSYDGWAIKKPIKVPRAFKDEVEDQLISSSDDTLVDNKVPLSTRSNVWWSKLPPLPTFTAINDSDSVAETFAYTTLSEVKAAVQGDQSRKPSGYWTFERCKLEAAKFKTGGEFKTNNRCAYIAAVKNSWLDKLYQSDKKPRGYWTFERCKLEAAKFKTSGEFSINSPGAHHAARKNGWLDKLYQSDKKPNGYWTFEKCKLEAAKFKTSGEFYTNSRSAYSAVIRNGWLDKLYQSSRKPSGYWTFERCKLEAAKFKTGGEFKTNNRSAYRAARKNGWLDKFFS